MHTDVSIPLKIFELGFSFLATEGIFTLNLFLVIVNEHSGTASGQMHICTH